MSANLGEANQHDRLPLPIYAPHTHYGWFKACNKLDPTLRVDITLLCISYQAGVKHVLLQFIEALHFSSIDSKQKILTYVQYRNHGHV